MNLGVTEDKARNKAWSFYFITTSFAKYPWDQCISDQTKKYKNKSRAQRICGWIKAHRGASEINYHELAKDLVSKNMISVMENHVFAEIVAKYYRFPYKDFSECVHDQMNKHNMSKNDAVKRCKVFAAKGIHGGIPSKNKKKGCGCN